MAGTIGGRAGLVALVAACALPACARGAPFTFSTGNPDGRMALASRPAGPGTEIEAADDFALPGATSLSGATFTGLLPAAGVPSEVRVEFYGVFPTGSDTSRSPLVPTRVNSPSDGALATRDSAAGGLTFTTTLVNPSFTASNSVRDGIYPSPNQKTGGDGLVNGQETVVNATFAHPVALPAGHYFAVPQVKLASGDFYWLSTAAPIDAGDAQAWIRNAALAPDWLRVGTDIVGGSPPPRFNAAFTLRGDRCGAIALAPDALPVGTDGQGYDATLSASGGTAPYAFATSGTLPPGTALSPAGRLAGMPAAPGSFAFEVTATDASGCTGTRSYTVDVAAATPPAAAQPGPGAAPPVPVITRARLSPRRFRAAKGATLVYADSRAATTTLAVARVLTGHRAGGRCRSGRPRHGQRRCTRFVARGALVHRDAGGSVRLHFGVRVRGRRLAPGRYRLSLTPRADGRTGRTVVLAFTVVRRA